MRQETNNEIDLLLRRMSRQDGGSVRDQHLDADELSSYAQNALPAAARARYMGHLAECATCRKLVTELSLSLRATAAAAVPVETVAAPSALKKFLASLFSPMVLRYAVPALAVIIVGVIGFAIFRQKQSNTLVAQLDERQSARAPATSEAPAPSSSPNTTVNEKAENDTDRVAAKTTTPQRGYVADDAAGSGPAPAGTPAPDNTAAPVTQAPKVAAAEPPPAKGDIAAENEEQKKQEQKTKDVVTRKEPAPPASIAKAAETGVGFVKPNEQGRDYNAAPQTSTDRVEESKRQAPAERTATFGGANSVRRGRSQTGSADAEVETRTVSGRRFRKERGIWTDTAYDSSTPIVSMARGSEQFRALVADEPEIKKIAEQLDGEVIVVWKGRAYRIR
jgi:hypothetical protein